MKSIPNITGITVYSPIDLVRMTIAVNETLTGRCRKHEFALMLGTAAVESDMTHRIQIHGPARGLFQMEPATARDIFVNYLPIARKRKKLIPKLMYVWLCLESLPFFEPTESELEYHLQRNDGFACAMARLHYLRRPEPIPTTLNSIARYWKKFYNTEAGAGTVADFKAKWSIHQCARLLYDQFNENLR